MRTVAYDREAVLERAMTEFWRSGYEATSLSDLLTATGLSKSSLYAAFGGKHDLFLAAYDRYRDARDAELQAVLRTHPAPEGIRVFFERIVDQETPVSRGFGCMSTNQAIERGAVDEAVRARVDVDYRRLEDAFGSYLAEGQRAGTVPAELDVAGAASALVTAFSGFQLTVRAGLSAERLRRALEHLMTPLAAVSASVNRPNTASRRTH